MPRPQRQKLTFEFDSLQKHMQEVYNQLEELRLKATRDYNRVIDILSNTNNDTASVITLEMSRNNALAALDKFHQKKIELFKVHRDICLAMNKAKAADEDDFDESIGLTADVKQQLQRYAQELREIKPE